MRWYPPLRQDDAAKPLRGGLGGPQRADSAPASPVNAEAVWRGGYRQIEQTLALLVHDPDVDAKALQRFAAALDARLSAADPLLYPIAEISRRAPLTRQRELNRSLRALLAKATKSGVDKASRQRCLRALESSFRKHVRLDEAPIVPRAQAETGSMPLGPGPSENPPRAPARA